MSPLTSPPTLAPSPTASDSVSWTDPARQALFDRWLSGLTPSQGLLPATLRVASADASFRRYLRVDSLAGDSRIVMDAPPDKENSEPFVRIAALMKAAGLNAPEVLDWHEAHGFMLLTDLGDATMMSAIDPERPQANHGLYMQAVDTLVQWQLASRPGVLPPYDTALLHRELSLFPDWYLAQHRDVQLQGAQREVFDKAFALIVQRNLAAPSVYVHRDFMPRNLMMPFGANPQLGVLEATLVRFTAPWSGWACSAT
jgi:aminoglycoside/choline kinase family phosphotransferase